MPKRPHAPIITLAESVQLEREAWEYISKVIDTLVTPQNPAVTEDGEFGYARSHIPNIPS